MSSFDLNPMFLRMRKSLGNIVIYQRNGKYFTRVKPRKSEVTTEAQAEVHNTFSRLADCWSESGSIIRSSWLNWGESRKINGYNGFMQVNFAKERVGEPLELAKQLGEIEPPVISAVPGGPGEIVCTFSISPSESGRYIHFFLKQKVSGISSGHLRRISAGADAVSPFTINGLTHGSEYFLYTVLTDSEFKTSTEVSASAGITVIAGS